MTIPELLVLAWVCAASIVTVASIIAAVTPSPVDDEYVSIALKILYKLALNIGYATPFALKGFRDDKK